MTWKLAGFLPGTAYLHVARRNAAGKTVTVRTLKLGTLAAPCGALTVRTKQLPLARPEAGRVYELRFSATRSPDGRRPGDAQRAPRAPRTGAPPGGA